MQARRRVVVVEFVEGTDGIKVGSNDGLWHEQSLMRWWLSPKGNKPPYVRDIRILMLQSQEEVSDVDP